MVMADELADACRLEVTMEQFRLMDLVCSGMRMIWQSRQLAAYGRQ